MKSRRRKRRNFLQIKVSGYSVTVYINMFVMGSSLYLTVSLLNLKVTIFCGYCLIFLWTGPNFVLTNVKLRWRVSRNHCARERCNNYWFLHRGIDYRDYVYGIGNG